MWSLTLLWFYAFLTFSSILKMPSGAPTNMRLNVLGRQRRSSVLRRVRVRSAMVKLPSVGAAKQLILQYVDRRALRAVATADDAQRTVTS